MALILLLENESFNDIVKEPWYAEAPNPMFFFIDYTLRPTSHRLNNLKKNVRCQIISDIHKIMIDVQNDK